MKKDYKSMKISRYFIYVMFLLLSGQSLETLGLTITNNNDNPTPRRNDRVTFFIEVANGPGGAEQDVQVDISLPAEAAFDTFAVSKGFFDGSVWTISRIESGETILLAIETIISASAELLKTICTDAIITDAYGGVDCYGADACFASSCLRVTPECFFENPCVSSILHSGMSFVGSATSQGMYDPYSGNWSIGPMLEGESQILDITAEATESLEGMFVDHCAELKDPYGLDVYDENNISCVTFRVFGVDTDLSLMKLLTHSDPAVGDTITYSITVTNNGPDPSRAAQVDDLLPTGLTYISSFAFDGSYDAPSGVWSIGKLAPGQSSTLFITAAVTGLAGTDVINTATVSDPYTVDPYDDNTQTVTFTIAPQSICDLSIQKSSDVTTVAVGSPITFTITVENIPLS